MSAILIVAVMNGELVVMIDGLFKMEDASAR